MSIPTKPPVSAPRTPALSAPPRAPRGGGAQAVASVGIFGASGTTGVELVRVLEHHSSTRLQFATSRAERGKDLDEVDPSAPAVRLVHPDDVDPTQVDVALLCVPHGTAGALAARCVDAGCRVVDVSGDHRLRDDAEHSRHYGSDRDAELAAGAVYGLPELGRAGIGDAPLVANPGCYATASILALAPLSASELLGGLAVIDAKSGVSGSGRTPNATNHFCSASGDVRPYKLGRAHRHTAEIEQELARHDPRGSAHPVVFNPHLVPIERGIEATVVVAGCDAAAVRAAYRDAYEDEPFVRVLAEGREARVRAVVGSNRADLGVRAVDGVDAVVITVAIDNLLKGAAGQAVQNMNLMLGIDETVGLRA